VEGFAVSMGFADMKAALTKSCKEEFVVGIGQRRGKNQVIARKS